MKNRTDKGFFITLEGPEGAGKSSQADFLARHLTERGFTCLRTREPGGTPLAEELRKIIKGFHGQETVHDATELLLIEAARAQHIHEVILPALERGEIVICDRFADSTTAYQGGARGMETALIRRLNLFASGGREPDLTLLLDLAPETGFARIQCRAKNEGSYDRFEAEKLEFHRKVREAFLQIAQDDPERVRVIQADRPIEQIREEIKRIADELIR